MIIVVKHGADEAKLQNVIQYLEARGFEVAYFSGGRAHHYWVGGSYAGAKKPA